MAATTPYDDNLSALVFTYSGRGSTEYAASTTAPTEAGDYWLTISTPAEDENYYGIKNLQFTVWPGTEHVFSFEVTVKDDGNGLDFAIPLSGASGTGIGSSGVPHSDNYGKAYNWKVEWGDGVTEVHKNSGNEDTSSKNEVTSSGLSHTYTQAKTYTITITPNGSEDDAWLAAFGFNSGTGGANVATNKAKLTKLISPITPIMTRTAKQISGEDKTPIHFEWYETFYGCTGLGKMGDDFTFSGWDGITTARKKFAGEMFYGCSGAEFTMSKKFNLPQGLETVEEEFAYQMFSGCNGANFTMGDSFNLPQSESLTTVGDNFALEMFAGCSGAAFNMNAVFNLPQKLETVGNYFAYRMFFGCKGANFNMNAVFNLPQSKKLTSVGDIFAREMFYGCSGAAFNMNAVFNLPQGITSVGDSFVTSMFNGCSGAAFTMGKAFNLPQGITTVGRSFALDMFNNCFGANFNMNSVFNLPQSESLTSVGDYFAQNIFYGCSGEKFTMNAVFNLPQSLTTVGNNFAEEMFRDCKGAMFTMNAVFNLPQSITAEGISGSFASSMFYGCKGAGFAVNDVFTFPTITKENVFTGTFRGVTAKQERLATSIIGKNGTPSSARGTFTDATGFHDRPIVATNWGGLGKTPITITADAVDYRVGETPATPGYTNLAASGSYQIANLVITYKGRNGTEFEPSKSAPAPTEAGKYTVTITTPNTDTTEYGTASKDFTIRAATTMEFSFEVTVKADGNGLDFAIPLGGKSGTDSGHTDNYDKAYDWKISWGDGSTEKKASTYTGAPQNVWDSAGLSHTYETAGIYEITITPNGSEDAWLAAFGFATGIEGASKQTNKAKLTKLISPITPIMTRTAAQIENDGEDNNPITHFEWYEAFYGCTGLGKMGDDFTFSGWDGITAVGDGFAASMFNGCTGDDFTMGTSFNLPQNIETAGTYFAAYMFAACGGANFTMNDEFNLPQSLTTVGDRFADNMFLACSGAVFTMNDEFNLPQSLTTVGDKFAENMFYGCSGANFTINEDFNLPQKITIMGSDFAYRLFYNCTGESFMVNDEFAFPITTAANAFYQTFYGVTAKQKRLASSIIGKNETPSSAMKTFTDATGFHDRPIIDTNWGGLGKPAINITATPVDYTAGSSSATGYEDLVADEAYDGNEDQLAVTYEGRDGTVYGPSDEAPSSAGEYTVTITTPRTDTNEYGALSLEFTVKPKPAPPSNPEPTVTPNSDDDTYKVSVPESTPPNTPITFTPSKGEAVDEGTVLRVTSPAEMAGEFVGKSIVNSDGSITFIVPDGIEFEVVNNAKRFDDVNDEWFADNVEFTSARELFTGTTKTTFSPHDPTTRAMFATVLWRLEMKPEESGKPFDDTDPEAYYADAALWGENSGVIEGVGDNKFAPRRNISREELVTMMYRYAKYLGLELDESGDLSTFTDAEAVSNYAEAAMKWAVKAGIIEGKGDKLDPRGKATRAECAATLQRFVEYLLTVK